MIKIKKIKKGDKTPRDGILLSEEEYNTFLKERAILDQIQEEIQTWNTNGFS